MPGLHDRLIKAWERTQVELHGTYSTDRVLALAQYTQEKSWAHIVMVLLVTPLPCLTITVLSDVLPLADPSEGVEANKTFQLRQLYTFVVISFLCTQQFRASVRDLPYPMWRVVRNAVIVALFTVAVLYGLTLWIGFPVPFSIIFAIPSWIVFFTISMAAEWRRSIQQNPGTETMVFNTVKVLLCEVLLVVTYPPYFYVFTTLSKTGQMLFAALPPVIKLVMRNIFNMTVVHLSDEMPEVVVFNSEVFNALFVSYCMQSSPSFGTTLMVTAALLVQLAMSLRDVNIAVHRTELVGSHLTGEHGGPYQLIAKSSIGCCKPSTLECAYTLLRSGAVQNATAKFTWYP
ncbi:hypothetical protein PR003_g30992 [Phytophthora rubi]|uniref:Uncharacterized protein n=1 Tax=Phytophthora rubi TaxID=129364 RepID=A0A6A4BC73_9STRA|nr:hypothetical protein PR001_g29865 [Phytophthora rubi]KAE9269938.1 hypothetical protein PR003_g30992 [Phytophthora rubi]